MANQDFRVKNGLQVGLGASIVGIVTAESFTGSAVGLTSVPSASLTGTISSERLSGTYDIDILGTVSGATISATTATVTEQLNVGAGDTGVFATATDGTLLVTGIATFKDRVIFDSTNSIQIPVGTEAEKDIVGTAVTGQIRYNTTNSQFEGFGPGNDWGSLGGVKDVDGDTYVKPESSPGSDEDALTFFTGSTERAVIDSNGNVGIATTNPTSTLDVDGTLNVSGVSTFQNNVEIDSTGYLQIPVGLSTDRPTGTGVTLGQIRYNSELSQFEGYGAGNAWGSLGGIKDVDQDTYITAESSAGADEDALTFFTGGTEKAVIDSTGKVGIGSTQPTSTLDVDGTLNVSGVSTFNDKVAIGTDVVSTSGKLHFPTADGYINRSSISVGNPIIDYGLYVIDSSSNANANLRQNYVRQTTSGNYSVSVGAANAFRISNNNGSSASTGNPGGMQDSEIAFVVNPDTSTELRYNYDKKFETTGYGVSVYGGLDVTGISTFSDDLIVGTATTGVVARTDGTLNVTGISTFSDDLIVGTATTGVVARNDGTLNVSGISTFKDQVHLPNGSATLNFGPDIPNADLVIGHNGQFPNSGYIANLSGDLDYLSQKHIFSDELEQWKYLELSDTESALYGANTKKLSVSSSGVSITDDVNVGSAGTVAFFDISEGKVGVGTLPSGTSGKISLPTEKVPGGKDALISAGNQLTNYGLYVADDSDNANANHRQLYVRQFTTNHYTVSVGASKAFRVSNSNSFNISATNAPGGMPDDQVAFVVNPDTSTELRYNYTKKLETTTDGFKVVNGTSETAVISGPQNIILDPSPDDVVAIVEGDISAAGVSTITGITTTNIAVGNLIQEVDGVISAGTTVTSVGASQVGISKTSLGSATNQEFTFANQTPTGIVRIKGDLYVDGTRTEINSTTLTVDDLNVVVASGATNGLTADGAGLTVDGANAHLKYNYNAGTNENWEINKNLNIDTSDPTINLIDDTSDANNNNYEIANAGGYFWIRNTTDSNYLIRSTQNDNLQLYGGGTTVLETNSNGIDITGITTISQQLLINDFADTSSALGTKLYVNGPSVFQETVRVGVGGTIGDLLVSGKVGIGTTQATAKLDVDGTLNVSGVSTFRGNVSIAGTERTLTLDAEDDAVNIVQKPKIHIEGATSSRYYKIYALDSSPVQYIRHHAWDLDFNISVSNDRTFLISGGGSFTQQSGSLGILDSNIAFKLNPDTSTELRYNKTKKLETTGYGVSVYGGLDVSGISTFASDLDINASVDISTNLTVNGISTFSDDLIVGTATTGVVARNDGTLNVSGISTFQDDVKFPSAGANGLGNILYDKSTGELKFSGVGADKIKSTYNYGGDSFSVYQNLTNQSLIQSNTATDLYIAFNGSTYITDQAGSNKSAVFNGTGAAELYNNNSKKLETTGYGVTVTGGLNVSGVSTFLDDVNIGTGGTTAFFDISSGRVGIGSTQPTAQLNVYNPSTTGVSTQFKVQSGPTDYISFERSGTFNEFGIVGNSLSFNTDSDFGVNNKAGDESYISVSAINGQVSLYHGKSPSSLKFSTMSYGINVTGRVETDTLNVSGISTFGSDVDINADVNVSGITTIGNYLNIGGSDISIGSTTINGDQVITFDGTAGNLFTLTDNLTTGNLFAVNDISGFSVFEVDVDGTVRMGFAANDKVGIGSTAPTAKLDVDGTLNVSGISTFGSDVDINADVNVSGIVTAAEFVGGGSDLRNLSGTHLVSYASASDISNSALSISGISTYNEVGILTGTYVIDDSFGTSVATSADGKTIIVGATGDEISGNDGYGLVYVYDREGNNFNEVGILTGTYASDLADWFGSSVATSADGKTIIVGARRDDINPSGIGTYGVVYVFDREGNNFNEVGILTGTYASDNLDHFGHSVATSADGKTIIVGARQDEHPTSASSSGVVYVFDRDGNNFNEVGILTGSYASDSGDEFGHSVATSADGKTIVVGAYVDETSVNSGYGLVYVFDREGNNFNQVGILTGTYASDVSDYFGYSVATSADGKTIVVGARRDETSDSDTGVVYVFDREGNNFNEVGILTGSYASDYQDYFGWSVATSADGKTIVVGASGDETSGNDSYGLVYVFNRQGNNFNQVGILTGTYADDSADQFGHSVATSADGKTIVVGALGDEIGAIEGLVYVFDQERETYVFSDTNGNIGIGSTTPTAKLDVNGTLNVSGVSTFAGRVAVGTDATPNFSLDVQDTIQIRKSSGNLAILQFNANSTKLHYSDTTGNLSFYTNSTERGYWGYTGGFNVTSGGLNVTSGGLDVTGHTETDTLNVSGIATAQKFVGDGSELTNLPPAGSDLVTYASASNIANSAESISGISTYIQLDSLLSSQTAGAARPWRFGYDNAMSADASTLIVGAYEGSLNGSSDNTGLVHVFDREGNSYREVGILTAGAYADNGDNFGHSVACSTDGRRIVVGAYSDEPLGSTGGGLVHIFDRQGDTFTRVGVLTGSYASQSGDAFGYEVDCSGDGNVIVVGAKFDETGASFSTGVVYVFDRNGNDFTEVGIITSSSNAANGILGHSVSISEDGNTIVAGAIGDGSNNEGKVYVFDRTGTNTFNEVGILTGGTYANQGAEFGEHVKISSNGKTIVVGCSNAEVDEAVAGTGLVQIFDRNPDNTFTRVGVLTGSHASQSTDSFGSSIDVSADGNTIAVGAFFDELTGGNPIYDDDGLGYIFTRQGDTFEEVSTFIQGRVPKLSADGKTVAFGDPNYESGGSGAGRVLIFEQQRQTYLHSTSTGNIGIGVTNPTAKLDVDGSIAIKNHSIVSITTSHTASAGTPFTIDTFATSENDLAEYTIHVGYGNTIQAQKVLVMHDGTTAYSQEYAVMSQPSKIVSIEAFISGSNILLRATPETGVSGITTYKIVRGGLV